MKILLFVVSLLLSIPNLIAGLVLLIWGHGVSTRKPLEMITDFLFGMTYGPLVTLGVIILLLLAGCITETRPYAAALAFILNGAALILVLVKVGGPTDLGQAVFFLPVILALIGFGWIAYNAFATRLPQQPLLDGEH